MNTYTIIYRNDYLVNARKYTSTTKTTKVLIDKFGECAGGEQIFVKDENGNLVKFIRYLATGEYRTMTDAILLKNIDWDLKHEEWYK